MGQLHNVIALARDFAIYEEARRSIGRLHPDQRVAALIRGLRDDADSRSVVIAALIVHAEPALLDGLKRAC